MMIAPDCSTFSVARFYATHPGAEPGPPPVRTKEHPDGLPPHIIDPKHVAELRKANKLVERCVDIALAARSSPARTTIVLENPADRSVRGTAQYCAEFSNHGSIFATSEFKRLAEGATPNELCTFAQCRLGSEAQKYTTLFYTSEAATVLRRLNDANYQCNHETSHAAVAGGRDESGKWRSAKFSAYPRELNSILAEAFTRARVGAKFVASPPADAPFTGSSSAIPPSSAPGGLPRVGNRSVDPLAPGCFASPRGIASKASPSSEKSRDSAPYSGVHPISFPSLDEVDLDSATVHTEGPQLPPWHSREVRGATRDWSAAALERQDIRERKLAEARRARAVKLNPITESSSPLPSVTDQSEYAFEAYDPLPEILVGAISLSGPAVSSALERGACSLAVESCIRDPDAFGCVAISEWMDVESALVIQATLASIT